MATNVIQHRYHIVQKRNDHVQCDQFSLIFYRIFMRTDQLFQLEYILQYEPKNNLNIKGVHFTYHSLLFNIRIVR